MGCVCNIESKSEIKWSIGYADCFERDIVYHEYTDQYKGTNYEHELRNDLVNITS